MEDKKKYYWFSLGEEGVRISKILHGVDPHNDMKCLQKWVEHLDKELTFPIQAIVSESEDNWLIKSGDKVVIKSLTHIVDMYGVIASIRGK
ncbi:MAG: calcium-binding protein [Bacteroidota bacterium]|nr:calcium-binding protein [Bacteroidota bacterium]